MKRIEVDGRRAVDPGRDELPALECGPAPVQRLTKYSPKATPSIRPAMLSTGKWTPAMTLFVAMRAACRLSCSIILASFRQLQKLCQHVRDRKTCVACPLGKAPCPGVVSIGWTWALYSTGRQQARACLKRIST